MTRGVICTAEANHEGHDKVMGFVEAELKHHHFPEDLLPDILVAVEEIFSNIMNYAYNDGESGNVSVSVLVNENAVICFEDSGVPYNPLEKAAPDLSVPLREREIGGLGIYFVIKTMDKTEYEYVNNKNVLTITKSRQPGGSENVHIN